MVHIGMAGPRMHYCIERLAHRDGYAMKDVDGALLRDDERHAREGAGWIWHGLPAELRTDFDVDDVLRRWKSYSPVSTGPLGRDWWPYGIRGCNVC